jgi:hypothetical protein
MCTAAAFNPWSCQLLRFPVAYVVKMATFTHVSRTASSGSATSHHQMCAVMHGLSALALRAMSPHCHDQTILWLSPCAGSCPDPTNFCWHEGLCSRRTSCCSHSHWQQHSVQRRARSPLHTCASCSRVCRCLGLDTLCVWWCWGGGSRVAAVPDVDCAVPG